MKYKIETITDLYRVYNLLPPHKKVKLLLELEEGFNALVDADELTSICNGVKHISGVDHLTWDSETDDKPTITNWGD